MEKIFFYKTEINKNIFIIELKLCYFYIIINFRVDFLTTHFFIIN